MKLKKLKIVGFKSFAFPVKLEFHEGITAIVGPNGCGKSNIADAFRWVLGEQSAKSLRGGKMHDVIFAGTSQRKPLNLAEVTLTMSGVEERLPLGYDEVAVTRRLHRSGESDYCINNQSVRLKDVQDLFLDSGIGKDAFAIFEQGKIDQVIQNSPLERRYIFEEAAGILRFLQRKREALRRLEQTDINVSRLKDILLEVERQIVALEEQSEEAKKYKDNRAILEGLEKAVIIAKWDQLQKKREGQSQKDAEQQVQLEASVNRLKEHESALQHTREALTKQESALKEKNEEVYRSRSDQAIKEREKKSHQERLREGAEKEKRWRKELETLLEKRSGRQLESQTIHQKQQDIEKELARLEALAKEQRERVAAAEARLSKMRDQQTASQQKLMTLLQAEGRLESELKQNTVRLENDNGRKLRLLQRKEILSKQLFDMAQQAKEKQAQSKTTSEGIDEQKIALKDLELQYEGLSKTIQEGQETLNALQQDIHEIKARQKVLERMRMDMEGFSSGTKRLLQESQNAKSPLHGKIQGLHEYLNVKKGGEALVAAALKPYAQTLVVKDAGDLQTALTYAHKHKLKDYSLLCLGHLPKKQKVKKAEMREAASLIDYIDSNVVASHLIQDVVITDTQEEAHPQIQNGPIQVVTKDGFYVDGKHVLFQPNQTESNVFVREAELKASLERLAACEAKKQECERDLQGLLKARADVYQKQMAQDKAIRKAEMTLLEINFAIQRLQGDEAKGKQEIMLIEGDFQAVTKQVEILRNTLKEVQQKYAEAKAEAGNHQKQSVSVQEEVQQLASMCRQEQHILRERETAAHKVVEEHKKWLHALHVIEVKELESIDQEKRLTEEIRLIQELQTALQSKQADADKDLQAVEARLLAVTEANAEAEKEVAAIRKKIGEIEDGIALQHKRIKQVEQEWNQTRISIAQLEASHIALESELRERFQLTVDDARSGVVPLEKSIEHGERQIKTLRLELEAFGDVNLASIDECEKNKSRYGVLDRQIDDLNSSRRELIQVIAELDGESRKIFKDTFEKVRVNFRKNFEILFNGGDADLQFTETDDVLGAGIEIIARPPGKQMRSIQLLSGGEKCLTALALLFAIFEVKPAPFCVLDEIDAPLDDANVERFVQMVKHYMDRCQFIIITHNKKTMAIADVIFGVSMEERGVSKLLSLEFAKEQRCGTGI